MSKLNKLFAEILFQCCNDPDGIYNLLLTKLLPSQINKITDLKQQEDNIIDNNEEELTNLYDNVYDLQDSDPIVYIVLTDDLVDIENRDQCVNNIQNVEYYPDELKCIATEAFNMVKQNLISEDGDCGGGDAGGFIGAGGDISPLDGEIGCPPPHFSDKYNHLEGLPMKRITGFKTRPSIFPSLGMYSAYYDKQRKPAKKKRNFKKK